jgi:hypothetical protein
LKVLLRAGLAALVALTGALVIQSHAEAKAPAKSCNTADANLKLESRKNALEQYISDARQSGASREEIASHLKNNFCLEDRTKKAPSGPSRDSSNGDIAVNAPEFYYSNSSGLWLVYAGWRWNSVWPSDNDRSTFCQNPCALGGQDGFGIALSQNAVLDSYSEETGGHRYGWYAGLAPGRLQPSDANSAGVTFTGIDHAVTYDTNWCMDRWSPEDLTDCGRNGAWCKQTNSPARDHLPNYICRDYSFLSGTVYMYVRDFPCGQTIQAFAKYAHSWSSTAVNGIGVGVNSLTVQWSSSSNGWERASQPSQGLNPC